MALAPLKTARLKVRREFLHVAKGGYAARPGVLVQSRPRAETGAETGASVRVGFTASRKVGNAVARNRCKRRLREAARALLPLYGTAGNDYVFIARAGTQERAWPALLDDVKAALLSVSKRKEKPSAK